jgi:hypothetical protein
MRQNGWLDSAYGVWHLVLEDDEHPMRYCKNRDSALVELEGEGWLLLWPFPRRYRWRWILNRTYSLVRLLQ